MTSVAMVRSPTVRCRLLILGVVAGVLPSASAAAQSTGPTVGVVRAAVPAACADSAVPAPEHREPGSYRPLLRREIAVPPLPAATGSTRKIRVEFLVSSRGSVDSVAIHGDLAPEHLVALRRTLMTHTFWPALYRGCAVPARMEVELSLP